MLQDPNVERYVEQAMKPVLKQINELKAEVEELKKALHKTDVSSSVPSYRENWNPDWKGDPDDPNRWNGW